MKVEIECKGCGTVPSDGFDMSVWLIWYDDFLERVTDVYCGTCSPVNTMGGDWEARKLQAQVGISDD